MHPLKIIKKRLWLLPPNVLTPFSIIVLLALVVSCSTTQRSGQQASQSELEVITSNETILQLQQRMNQQQFSAQELTRFYLTKIKQNDHKYNSVIRVNPNAVQRAIELDRERALGNLRGPLHGIPILVKDNIETADMPTTAGSLALANNQTKRDATLIRNLKQAGAIILGKTNLSEWANIRSERSSSGWSAIGGQTRNPHDTNRSACGSSSGSGAAIAANFAVAAIGTETNGSITCPASVTGVVGIKPSVGWVSRFGIIPISHTQDTAGPMTKNITDAAILLQFMGSADQNDLTTLDDRLDRSVDLTPSSNSDRKLRLGLQNSSATNHERVALIESQLIEQLQKRDWLTTKYLSHSPYQSFWKDTYTVLLYQLKNDLNRYFEQSTSDSKSWTLQKLIEFNRLNREQEMPFFQQEIFEKAQQKGSLDTKEYQEALNNVTKETQQSILHMLNDNQLDAIIAITRGPAWSIDRVNGDNTVGGVSTYSAVAGFPHITIPLGKVHNLPIGLSIMGKRGDEQALISIAYQLENWIETQDFRSGKPVE